MQKTELEQKILDYIKSCYKAEYIGFLEVEELHPGYIFKIGVPSYITPTVIISYHNTEEEFLEFIKLEIRQKNFMRVDYYNIIRISDDKKQD